MNYFRKPVYVAAGYTTTFFGSGRKEFNPQKPMPPFEDYLLETAKGTSEQIPNPDIDEGIIASFMPARFLKQANLPGFLPFMMPRLYGKPCTGVEGACGSGGRAIAAGVRSVLSDISDVVFVSGFEIQNTVKAVYGSDILAGAAYYRKERKEGAAFFFPGIFAERAASYFKRYGEEKTRQAMARWYENAILNARKNPKAQEYHNTAPDLYSLGLTKPNPQAFLPCLNSFDCSKVSDGAASLLILSEEGLRRCGIKKSDAIELIGMGEAEGDITKSPEDLTALTTTEIAAKKSLQSANVTLNDLGLLEVHDCFSITGILSLEAIGFAEHGHGPDFVLEGNIKKEGRIPTNLSGGLCGFGHPTGATGVRQMVDLTMQLTGKAPNQLRLTSPIGMMVSMGGNDKTVTSFIVRAC